MNNEDRVWLARIDERTRNIWRLVEKMERHQEEQNGYIRENFVTVGKNTLWRKVIIGVGGSSIILIIGWLLKLTLW